MKKTILVFTALIAVLVLSVSCSTEIEPGITAKNDRLYVNYEGNATTGYMWVYSISDESVLTCLSDEYKPHGTGTGIVGAGGIWSAEFKALKSGTADLVLTYCRSWENGFAKRVILCVTVGDDLKISVTEKE